jgi:hypothetical protein
MLLRKIVDLVDVGFPAANLKKMRIIRINDMLPSALVIAYVVITAKLTQIKCFVPSVQRYSRLANILPNHIMMKRRPYRPTVP